MSRYIQFTTAEGGTILVEAPDEVLDAGPVVKGGLDDKVRGAVVEAKTTFEDAVDTIRQTAGALIGKVRSLADPPDEVEITFGLTVSGELGNFAVAKASAEANYEVKLTWKK